MMAIDVSKPVIDSSRFANGESGRVVTVQLGVDDGADFTAGDVVLSVDGALQLASERQRSAYQRRSGDDSSRAAGKSAYVALRDATTFAQAKAALLDLFRYIDGKLED